MSATLPIGLPFGHVLPSTGRGTGTSTSFFQIQTQAQRIVYVLDRSSSMGPNGALTMAARQVLASIAALPATAQFQIIVYNSHARPLLTAQPGWLSPSPTQCERIAAALAELNAEGGTRHADALPLALALRPEAIFFLTDADDLTLEYVRAITARNRGQTAIHTIELSTAHQRQPEMPLQLLARLNRGVYRAVALP